MASLTLTESEDGLVVVRNNYPAVAHYLVELLMVVKDMILRFTPVSALYIENE